MAAVDRPRYHPQQFRAPAQARGRFYAALTGGFMAFAAIGFFTSLAPTFLAGPLGHPSLALAGAVAFLVTAAAAVAPPAHKLAQIYTDEMGGDVADLPWFSALACFKSAATWSLIIKHNRRRRSPRTELEDMVPALPRLLARAGSLLD